MADSIMETSLNDKELEFLSQFTQQEDLRGLFIKESQKAKEPSLEEQEKIIRDQLNRLCKKM